MIVDKPQALLLFLLATTLLGVVIGYCIALIRAKRRAYSVIDSFRTRLTEGKAAVEGELKHAHNQMHGLEKSIDEANARANATLKREEALEVHSQLQARRIQTLESQLSSYEDQQIRLQRDFASYKSNKSRELELARVKPDTWSQTDQLPVLNKRIDDLEPDSVQSQDRSQNDSDDSKAAAEGRRSRAARERGGLSIPLSRELDIPSLSESELPDSVDELEFEMTDPDKGGDWPRG